MTRETLEKKISELKELKGKIYSFFVTWTTNSGRETNDYGQYMELNEILDRMESGKSTEWNLPFSKLILYFKYSAIVFAENEKLGFQKGLDDETHFSVCVPYMDNLGKTSDIDNGDSVFVITDEWTDWEKHYEFVSVYGDECEANKAALEMANSTYGHHFEVTKHRLNK